MAGEAAQNLRSDRDVRPAAATGAGPMQPTSNTAQRRQSHLATAHRLLGVACDTIDLGADRLATRSRCPIGMKAIELHAGVEPLVQTLDWSKAGLDPVPDGVAADIVQGAHTGVGIDAM